ncbi:MAG: hypothetical protein KatS3mg031_2162 [Chitinophagales bacterium]|nr:MAG: hypothetical protein KatS3mg031_2162 [Chitinophagales bacterium]
MMVSSTQRARTTLAAGEEVDTLLTGSLRNILIIPLSHARLHLVEIILLVYNFHHLACIEFIDVNSLRYCIN